MLREMLNRHPAFAIGGETAFLCDLLNVNRLATIYGFPKSRIRTMARSSSSVVRFAEQFFEFHAEREGKARWGDKTPRNVNVIPTLLGSFPRAVFIHVLRDGRDVACSLRNHPRESVRGGKVVTVRRRRSMCDAAARWTHDVSSGLAFSEHPRVCVVRYERLIEHPEAVLTELCTALEEPYDPNMLVANHDDHGGRLMNNRNASMPIENTRIGRWKSEMTQQDRLTFQRVAGETLIAAGYADDAGWAFDAVSH